MQCNLIVSRADILALEELSKHLFLELHDLQNMRERIDWSKSCQGKYFNFLGYFFSLYCVWKIFISTVNIVFDRVGKMDPITKTFDILVNWFGFDIDMEMWSQQLSFIVVSIFVFKTLTSCYTFLPFLGGDYHCHLHQRTSAHHEQILHLVVQL